MYLASTLVASIISARSREISTAELPSFGMLICLDLGPPAGNSGDAVVVLNDGGLMYLASTLVRASKLSLGGQLR